MTTALLDPADMTDRDWPAGSEAMRAYAEAFAREGSRKFVANVSTRMMVLRDGGFLLPVTVNETEYENSYVCSLHAYVLYVKAELASLRKPLASGVVDVCTRGACSIVRAAKLNRVVAVNNWLLSTSLYPEDWKPNIKTITDILVGHFPYHFIYFRCVNDWFNANLIKDLADERYRMIAYRQIYICDNLEVTWSNRSNARYDRTLLRRLPYEIVADDDIEENDYKRIADLYDMLNRQKYPPYNPALTSEFMRLCHRCGLMRFSGLRGSDGRLDGFLAIVTVGETITPIIGYDTTLDRKLGVYRALTALMFEAALDKGQKIHFSSGAGKFKQLRGGQPIIEYTAVFDRHIPAPRRLALGTLAFPVNTIGVPLMRKLQL